MHNKATKHFTVPGKSIELMLILTCSERPEVVSVPASGLLTVLEGETAELRCKVTRGSPAPDITWKREVSQEGREGG